MCEWAVAACGVYGGVQAGLGGCRPGRGRAPRWPIGGHLSWWGHEDLGPGTCTKGQGKGPAPRGGAIGGGTEGSVAN